MRVLVPDAIAPAGIDSVLPQRRGPRPVVVAVDDDPAVLVSMGRVLDDHFDVLTVSTGAGALTLLREHTVDVVLLDLLMPGQDGLEILQAIKAFDPRIEIIVVTAVRNAHLAVAVMKYGAFDYVTKPFDEGDLCSRITAAMTRRRRTAVGDPMQQGGPIFLIGTQPGGLAAVQSVIERYFLVRMCLTAAGAIRRLEECRPTVVIIDRSFPASERSALLPALRERAPECRVIDDEDGDGAGARDLDHGSAARAKGIPLKSLLRRIAAVLAPGQLPPGFPPFLNSHVLDVIDYVGRNHGQPIGLRSAAAAGAISPRHLAHLFHEDVGISLMEYVAKIRIEAAKTILSERDMPLDHLAASVGFSDASHLSRVFVRQVGERPGRYRRRRVV
jgi:DNA-binding NarL/FixJ family response regulator/AraC-like DNA-binding protein